MLNEMFVRAYAVMLSQARKQEGASAVEYGLILGLIAVVIIITLTAIGTDLDTLFGRASSSLADAATP